MNEMIVTAKHKVFVNKPVQEFNALIHNSTVVVSSIGDILTVSIHTRKNENNTKHLFFEIFSIIYICLGAFPNIESITFNGTELDLTGLAKKYYSREALFRDDLRITNISEKIVNQSVIDKFRTKQHEPISSLQYLNSAEYDSVVTDHRITLLLHIIDGICDASKTQLKTDGTSSIINSGQPK